ncbi:MAG: PKD domain-containing protein, partial [Candidatus Thiodiazotropha sp.]
MQYQAATCSQSCFWRTIMVSRGRVLIANTFSLLVLITLTAFTVPVFADRPSSSSFSIDSARWNERRNRLEVRGSGSEGSTVEIFNADSNSQLGSSLVGRRGWSFITRNPVSVPCRIRAEQSDGSTDERDVQYAPSNCDSGAGNVNPTANANGPYSGVVGTPVDFSSAGSTDSDGSIVSYAWDFGDGDS